MSQITIIGFYSPKAGWLRQYIRFRARSGKFAPLRVKKGWKNMFESIEMEEVPARRVVREPAIRVSQFVEPTSIPKGVPAPADEPVITQLPSESSSDGIPGGMSGGVMGGVIGGVPASLLGGPPRALPPPPPQKVAQAPRHHGPIVVAGTIEQAKLIERVPAVYPPLAAKARIQGVVILQITVGEKGNVEEVRVLRGSPLLDDAAVAAVRQWKYAPTILDGQPVPVVATVTVDFQLRTASAEASD